MLVSLNIFFDDRQAVGFKRAPLFQAGLFFGGLGVDQGLHALEAALELDDLAGVALNALKVGLVGLPHDAFHPVWTHHIGPTRPSPTQLTQGFDPLINVFEGGIVDDIFHTPSECRGAGLVYPVEDGVVVASTGAGAHINAAIGGDVIVRRG